MWALVDVGIERFGGVDVMVQGVLGANHDSFMATTGDVFGDEPPADLVDVDSPEYLMLAPELLADQIIYVIDQPWGVSISDVTVSATGDSYII